MHHQHTSADIAVVTVIQPEFQAMLARLQLPRPDPGTLEQPNQYAWHVGELSPARGGSAYRVVLALVGRPGEISAALAVQETIERWKPAYVVPIGIAGGLPIGGLDKGDVVVSSVIWGYEYGKIADGEFTPRRRARPCGRRLRRRPGPACPSRRRRPSPLPSRPR